MQHCKPISMPVECTVKLSKYNEGKSVDPIFFKNLVRCLCYLTCTKSNILYVGWLMSRYMENLKIIHFKVTINIFRYIKGTFDFGLLYSFLNYFKLIGYNDSDWGGDINDWKRTIGLCSLWRYCFHMDIRRSNRLSHFLVIKLNQVFVMQSS